MLTSASKDAFVCIHTEVLMSGNTYNCETQRMFSLKCCAGWSVKAQGWLCKPESALFLCLLQLNQVLFFYQSPLLCTSSVCLYAGSKSCRTLPSIFQNLKQIFFFLAFFFYSENYGIDFNQHFNATLIFPLRITMDLIFCHAHSNDNITSRHNCHNTSRHSWGNAFGWVAVLVFQFKKKYILFSPYRHFPIF